AALWAFPPVVASTLTVGLGVGLTGALHEDGLADLADALGGRSREEALRILRDPAHGTYGVVAIGLSLVLRVGAVAALDRWAGLAVLPAAHALSRSGSVGLLWAMRPASNEGLGAAFARAVDPRRAALAMG